MRVCLHPCRCEGMYASMYAFSMRGGHCSSLCAVNESDVVFGGSLPVHPRLRAVARACVRARVRTKIKESRKVIRT